MKKDNLQFVKGFDKNSFIEYMHENFNIDRFGIACIENIIDYAHKYEHVSKDQFCYFVSDILPEVEFSEVAGFCEDCILTSDGQYYKNEFWKGRNI